METKNETCQHGKFETHLHVGWDIDEAGEECQHLDICQNCRAKRFRIDRTNFNGIGSGIHLGNWWVEDGS